VKLQAKFNLVIVVTFVVLAVGIAAMSVRYVNINTIREAEDRVKVYARAAWEIHNGNIARTHSALEILAQSERVRNLIRDPESEHWATVVSEYLETVRREQEMDVLNLLTPDGTVILRTLSPYNKGDSLANDPMVRQVMSTQQSCSGNIILASERLDVEGGDLIERCLAIDGEQRGMLAGAAVPILEDGNLIGIIQMGSLLNGAVEEVDRIRDAVFKNEYYKHKPVGTATIFMGDLRISTNVMDNQGRRAVGTCVSREVAEQVLEKGLSWTGRAFVVDTWYLSQYDPIRDPDGNIIGILYVGELEQKYLDMRTRTVVLYLSVIFIGMILAFLASFSVIGGILGPIQKLSEATNRLSSGDLSYRVEVGRKDEVGDLSVSFNRMAEQLERQRQEIGRNQQKLEELNSELRAINQSYMEMLGFVTHELKNPLTSAIMSLYTVKDGYLGEINSAQRKSLESVAQSLDYFQDMVKNYLDLSRLEKGEFEVHKSQVFLHTDIVAPILEGLERALQERQMALENRIPEDLVLNADGDLLRIVYDNLLSNAIKYGREGGAIVLDAQKSDSQVTLSVRNDGEGIPPEKMPLLFKKFSRLDGPEYVRKKGTGLGLYICKEIVEKHGGEIWADSQAGEWVKFSFTLPNQTRRPYDV
jgi:two-component system NtrC family sensor kinase